MNEELEIRKVALDRALQYANQITPTHYMSNVPASKPTASQVLDTANIFYNFLVLGLRSNKPKLDPELVIKSEPIATREGVETNQKINKN